MKSDDWKDEINERMNKSAIYKSLKAKCSAKDHKVLALVNEACEYSYHRTKTILKHMGEFTIHDSDHSFRVIYLMERLLGAKNIQHLSPPELMLLILSAFFHDMGMAPNEKEIITWKKTWDSNPIFKTKNEKEIFEKFNRFYFSKPDQQEIINDLTSRNQLSKADIIKSYLISEYIRSTHSDRVREIIHKDWNNKIIFRDCDLTVELANLCESHDDDALKLLDLDKSYLCAPNTYVCLPLIGVMLRLADILDFDSKRTPTILFSHLYVRHPVSLVEWNKHRAVEAWDISPDTIQFSAKCSHPAIQESINRFCDMIDHELSVCNNIIFQINDYNKGKNRKLVIKFPFKVDRKKLKPRRIYTINPSIYIGQQNLH
jgi:molecular chaperone HtpG